MLEISKYLNKLVDGESLEEEEATRAFQIMLNGGATPAQIAAILVALRMKGENIDELVGAAKVMRAKCVHIDAPEGTLDTCGTGGDHSGSYNISTATAFVLAGCGVPVAKHGNRSITSRSGSSQVLEALSVNLDVDKEIMERALHEHNICFMMAPKFHKAMRHIGPTRQELAIRSIFNIVGPLSNPAAADYHLLGVYSKELTEPVAEVLKRLGCKAAWVVHGADGLDEITITDKTYVAQLKDDEITTFEIDPTELGLELAEPQDIEGGSPEVNAMALKKVLTGRDQGAHRDIVCLNAAAALVVVEKAEDLEDGLQQARECIDEGRALNALHDLVSITQEAKLVEKG